LTTVGSPPSVYIFSETTPKFGVGIQGWRLFLEGPDFNQARGGFVARKSDDDHLGLAFELADWEYEPE
jgi:hypothetical protein